MLNSVQDAVKQLLPAKKKVNSTSGWISFNAPCCHHNGESMDTRSRGGLVANAGGSVSYHCFNCQFKTSYIPGRHLTYKFRKFLSWLGADDNTVKRLVIDAIRIKDLVEPEKLIEAEEAEPIAFKARTLPEHAVEWDKLVPYYDLKDWADSDEFAAAVRYVHTRRIDLTKYKFYSTQEEQYNLHKRVIIPCTWKNEIIGYTARAFHDNVKPKYHANYESNYVFNTDKQLATSKFVIVVEGPFDAMAVDGVAILGNECSEIQADIIDSLGKEVIVVPDFDIGIDERNGRKKWSGSRLIEQAVEYGWTVSFPIWHETCKDVSNAVETYGKLFVLKSILDAKETSKLKIELLTKRMYN